MASNETINYLTEMGFTKEKAEQAETATKGQGLQAAIDWLVADAEGVSSIEEKNEVLTTSESNEVNNEGEEQNTSDESKKEDSARSSNETQPSSQTGMQALSLVCEECGKQLKSEMDAQAHAARTGHQQFAESSEAIRPLTEEEKQEQLKHLQQKLVERRQHRETTEKEEAKQREKIRRKMGKEITEAKQKHDLAEIQRIAEERRKEKHDDKLYRQRLKQKIAQDRANMKAAQASSSAPVPKHAPPPAQPPALKQEAKEYDTCRIQFRFPNGSTKTANFDPMDSLSELCRFASDNGYDGNTPLRLMTTFPRKTFGPSDMPMTLKELGLVPSSVIIVSRS